MSDSISHKFSGHANTTLSSSVTGEITVALVIVIFVLFAVALILYLRFKGYSGAIGSLNTRSQHLVFAPNRPNILNKPLDPTMLNSLPVSIFRSKDVEEKTVVECAVCLLELTDGEKARFLPKCKHGFHVECIDMWFHSNSTCPLCRNLVGADDSTEPIMEIPVLENGLDFKVNFDEGSSSSGSSFSEQGGNGMLGVEISSCAANGLSSSLNRIPTAGIASPALERLRSIRGILSRGNLNTISCFSVTCSPRGSDIEQGGMQKSLSVSETDSNPLV